MRTVTCVNLCDIFMNDQILKIIKEKESMNPYKRIYIGSYFCAEYFMNLSSHRITKILSELSNNDESIKYSITLVVPIFTQKNFKEAKTLIEKLMNEFNQNIDEITINDYGMLKYVHDQFQVEKKFNVKINAGRILSKDYREPRYPDYFNQEWVPKILNSYAEKIFKQYGVSGLEFDLTHRVLNFKNQEQSFDLAIHTPFAYMTTGKICEYASINSDVKQKFRPNKSCTLECNNCLIQYDVSNERNWFRLGRTIYFANANCEIRTKDNDYLLVYFPINELVEVYS